MDNKIKFQSMEDYWATARLDYLRDIPMEAKKEIERIYREEIDPNFFANYFCSACYLNCIKRLINHFQI